METIVSGIVLDCFVLYHFIKMKHTVYKACYTICYDDVLSPVPFFKAVIWSLNPHGGDLRSQLGVYNKPVTPSLWHFVFKIMFSFVFPGVFHIFI